MSENEIKPVAWFCPECGSEDHEDGDGGSKFCSTCGQEWFSGVNYSGVLQKNLKRLSSVVCSVTNESMPHVGAAKLQSAIDRLTAERDAAMAERDALSALLAVAGGRLEEAANEIDGWGAYADEYFQKKHRLAEVVQSFRDDAKDAADAARSEVK